jgi:hypothetical protein
MFTMGSPRETGYFAILNRILTLELNIKIPQNLGYGYYYDKLFSWYAKLIYRVDPQHTGPSFVDDYILPYIMLSNSKDLWMAYGALYDRVEEESIIPALESLKNGSPRDQTIDKIINDFIELGWLGQKYVRSIIKMMVKGEFDILDNVYLLLYTKEMENAMYTQKFPSIINFLKYVQGK